MKAPGWGGQVEEQAARAQAGTPAPPHRLPKAVRIEFFIVGGLVLATALAVKLWLRPHHMGGPAWTLALGVAPNYCAALGSELVSASRKNLTLMETLYAGTALLIYELLQLVLPTRTFDPFDALAVVVGTATYLVYRRARTRLAGVKDDLTTK